MVWLSLFNFFHHPMTYITGSYYFIGRLYNQDCLVCSMLLSNEATGFSKHGLFIELLIIPGGSSAFGSSFYWHVGHEFWCLDSSYMLGLFSTSEDCSLCGRWFSFVYIWNYNLIIFRLTVTSCSLINYDGNVHQNVGLLIFASNPSIMFDKPPFKALF
jgi:hypothetical protein